MTNGLERAAARLWPGLAEVKAALLEAGCLAALMSGSGPTVLGIAPSHRAALRIRDALGARPWRLWVTRTVTGPALTIRRADRPGDGPASGGAGPGRPGAWPSGKARDFGSRIRRFESSRPNHPDESAGPPTRAP